MTLLVISPASRAFCASDFPGQSFTMTCGMASVLLQSIAVLFVADLFHPVDDFAFERFLNRDVRHRRRRRGTVPMLLARREPDDVTRPDFLDRAALPLHPADAGGHDQRLAERMAVPGGTRAGLESDAGASTAGRIGCLEQRVDADRAAEPVRWPLGGRLRTVAFDFHD